MITLQWDQKFEVGHERIDAEHRAFLNLIRSISEENDRPRITRLLRELEKYAEFHFVSEENIMEDHGYPGLAVHRLIHNRLLSGLTEQLHAFRNGSVDVAAIVEFLFQWFALHTSQEDRKLVDFLSGATAG